MNMAALFFAIIAAVITFTGFGVARKFESEIISIIVKLGALAIGFFSMVVLGSLFQVEGASAAGGYWAYILIGVWVLSQVFKDPDQASRSGSIRSDGMSVVSMLLFVLLACGIYALLFKPSSKAVNEEAGAVLPEKPRIVIYTTSSCEPCDRAKAWMTQRRITFEERNVDASTTYEEELKNYKSRIVPVIVVNGEPQYGFEWAYLEQAINNVSRPQHTSP